VRYQVRGFPQSASGETPDERLNFTGYRITKGEVIRSNMAEGSGSPFQKYDLALTCRD
jgi:hypothetical protein